MLDRHGAAFCEHDRRSTARPPPRLTGGFRYVRFHGTTGKYKGRYGADGARAVRARPARLDRSRRRSVGLLQQRRRRARGLDARGLCARRATARRRASAGGSP